MIVLSTGSLYNYGLERVFGIAAATGFDGVEVLIDDRWDTRQPAYLRRLSSRYNLPIAALHNPFVSRVAGWPSEQLGRLERTVALAQALEVPVVVAHLPFRVYGLIAQVHGFGYRNLMLPLPIPWRRREPYYHALRDGRLQEMEAASGVTIAVENMPARRLWRWRASMTWFNTPREMTRFAHVTLDTTHLGTWGLEPVTVYEELKERIAHIHLANFDGREHRSPPDGHLKLDLLLQRMAQDGYQGAISVEGHPNAFEAEDEAKCRVALARALSFCRAHFRRDEVMPEV